MEKSPKPGKGLRSKIARIAAAIVFVLMICSVAAGTARADDHGKHGDKHHDKEWRGPDVYYAPAPDYYYQPPPDYYDAPEPDYYYPPGESEYYPPAEPEYYPPPPSEGIQLFFGR